MFQIIWALILVIKMSIMLTRKILVIFIANNGLRGRDDLFFALHLILGRKLDICRRYDLFCPAPDIWAENWTSAHVKPSGKPVLLLRS